LTFHIVSWFISYGYSNQSCVCIYLLTDSASGPKLCLILPVKVTAIMDKNDRIL